MSDQRGFSVVEGLLAVIAVTLIGFTGFYVYSNNKSETKADNPADTVDRADKADATNSDSAIDRSASWLLYSPPNKDFTIRLADGWNLTSSEDGTSVYSFLNDDVKFKEGVRAKVTPTLGGKDGSSGFFLNYYPTPDNGALLSDKSVKVDSFKTKDGVTVDKYEYTETSAQPTAIGQLAQGGVYSDYIIKDGQDMVMTVNYSVQPTDDHHFKLIEEVLRTVHFN